MRRRLADLMLVAVLSLMVGFRSHNASAQLADVSGVAARSQGLAALGQALRSDTYSLTSLRVVSKVVLLIKENYVDQGRVHPRNMLVQALKNVEREAAEILARADEDQRQITVTVGGQRSIFNLTDVQSLWEMTFKLGDIFRFIDRHLPADIDRRDIEYASVNGMLRTLDPHSVLLTPDFYEEMRMSTRGEFGGLGIVISIRDGKLTVISPIDGTPAYMAGIKAKDRIVRIGEESTINMALEEAVKMLRGAPGTQAIIWVQREGWLEPRKFVITRARIKIESVSSKLLAGDVGYVRIKSFQANTARDLDDHIAKLGAGTQAGLKGLVLDLRDNPGGLLEQAIEVSDRFLEAGVIVSTVGAGKPKVESAHWAGTESDLPVAVLVNGGSASASEIVSGAIKNDDRGVVVGEQTFGKGSVQVLYDFKDGSALKLTVAQYLTPGDISIQNTGITPDIQVQRIHATQDFIDLFKDTRHMREEDLDQHLNDARTNAQKPAVQVQHLEQEADDDPEAVAVREASSAFKADFEIDFARRLLAEHGASSRHALLQGAKILVADVQVKEEKRVIQALGELGVDWSLGPRKEGGKAVARLINQPRGVAGDAIPVEVEVENIGSAPLYRLHATTESKNYSFADREFVFGRLDPGAKRRWTVKLSTGKGMLSRNDAVSLRFKEQYGRAPADLSLEVVVEQRPRPHFELTSLIDDTAGNRDGLLQMGEAVELVVAVRNSGGGPSLGALVVLKNKSGRAVYITRGRGNLGEIKPGETKVARMAFELRVPPEQGSASFVLAVVDQELGTSLSQALHIDVAAPASQHPKIIKGRVATTRKPVLLRASLDPQAPVVAQLGPRQAVGVDARLGNELRVLLNDKVPVFAPSSELILRKSNRKLRKLARPALRTSVQAPRIDLGKGLAGSIVTSERITVRGKVRSTVALRDMFIYVGRHKEYYRSLRQVPGNLVEFESVVKLEEGPNLISVVARVDGELEAHASAVVRRVAGAVQVAAPTGERATQRKR